MCLYRVPQKAPGILFSNGLKQENKQDKKACVFVCVFLCVCACECARVLQREAEMREKEKKTKRTKSPERYYETAGRSGGGRMSREETREERLHQQYISGYKKIEMSPLCE